MFSMSKIGPLDER